MRKKIKIIVIIIIAAFVIIQFFQPEKNTSSLTADHIYEKENLPPAVKTILQDACMDCHSNQTNYLWYHRVVPVAWMINKHIVEGKEELNFSEWGEFDVFDKIGALEKISREVENKKMPIKSYTYMHKEAKLSEEQITAISDWTEKLSEELLTSQLKNK